MHCMVFGLDKWWMSVVLDAWGRIRSLKLCGGKWKYDEECLVVGEDMVVIVIDKEKSRRRRSNYLTL